MTTDYLFHTLTVPVTKNVIATQPVLFRPTVGAVTGGLIGAWLAGVTVAGEPYLPVFIVGTVLAFIIVGAVAGFNINQHLFVRKINQQQFALNRMVHSITRNVPQGWEIPGEEARTYLEDKTQAWVFDPAGLRWEIIDSFQDDKELILKLRRDNY